MGNGKSRPGGVPAGGPGGSSLPSKPSPAPASGGTATGHGVSSTTTNGAGHTDTKVGASAPPAGDARRTGGAGATSGTGRGAHEDHSDPLPIPARKAVLEDFIFLKTVGKGSFGKVVMVRKKDDSKVYAMKILKKEMVIKRKQFEHTLAERRILENIDHPFIVSLRFAFQSEHKLYMVFDFFNGGELYHYLSEGGRFTEERARFYAAEIVSALGYLHKRGIVYRDLKPENLILDGQGHIRITDFGLSKEGVMGDTILSICGTPEYLAPEILRKRPYGVAVDWWSMGTLLFEMIAGLPPFYDRNRQVMYRKILEAPLEPPPFMSAEAVDICSKLLIREPTARLGYHGVEEIKAHPFFKSIDWDKLDRKEIPPPWKPTVKDDADTRNIASEFTAEPAGVTPSPAYSKLRDLTGATPPSFTDFTFTHHSILDGQTYQVTFDDDDDPEGEFGASGSTAGSASTKVAPSAPEPPSPLDDSRPSSESDVDAGVMGSMEGLKLKK